MRTDFQRDMMRTLLAFLLVLAGFKPILAQENNELKEEIILPSSTPQKILSRYQTDFSFHHDKGVYFTASIGPQWNHSLKNPQAKGIRFGGKVGLGWYVVDGLALYAAAWGNFLEQASLVAGGPGIAILFDGPNMGIDLSLGIGRALSVFKDKGYKDFAETVLAGNLSIAKYWWVSDKNSLGLSLNSGVHGFSLSAGKLGTFGWSAGLSLAFLFG